MKLLERQAVVQNVQDGAVLNFLAAHRTNGKIYGCELTAAAEIVHIGAGVLVVRGFRFSFDANDVIYDGSAAVRPSQPTTYYIKLRLTVAANNADYQIVVDANQPSNSTAVEQGDGLYDYLMGTFTFSSLGIGSLASNMAQISTSGGGSSAVALTVPVPRLAVTSLKGAYYGVLVLANANEYAVFATDYTVQFVLARFVERARYRVKGSTPTDLSWKVKSGYVFPIDTPNAIATGQIGWQGTTASRKFRLKTLLSELTTVTLTRLDQTLTVKQVIEPIADYVDTMFYDTGETYDAVAGYMVRSTGRTALSLATNPYNVKCTRSRNPASKGRNYSTWIGPAGAWIRRNRFTFAYQAQLVNGQGTVVARSELSDKVTIEPSIRGFHQSTGNHTGVNYVTSLSQLLSVRIK